MSGAVPAEAATVWDDIVLAVELFGIDPDGLGGIVLRAGPCPQRERVCAWTRDLRREAPAVRLPIHVTDDRLLGGLSLAATLATGRVAVERGILDEADGGLVFVAMSERLEPRVTSHLCAALDRGEVALERDGITARLSCHIGVVALDEGLDDERPPAALLDRLAFHLHGLSAAHTEPANAPDMGRSLAARALLASVAIDESCVEVLCEAAAALGVDSLRAPLLAAAAARANAALHGRTTVVDMDVVVAARLVLGPRATRLPHEAEETAEPEESPSSELDTDQATADQANADDSTTSSNEPRDGRNEPESIQEIVLAAAKSGIPAGILDGITVGRERARATRAAGKAGAVHTSMRGGRPAGTRASMPRDGERINVVETLRAAAPWQLLRRREMAKAIQRRGATIVSRNRIEVRPQDLRVSSFRERMESSVIFAVDASGSAALQRLAEAKGAVEQVLADCYVRRDQVALVAFRGTTASLLVPPTRSLARVRRCLADLAGGGTTPLALGIATAMGLALEARKRGRTAVLVLMTDGRANVAKDGTLGGPRASEDAIVSARAVRAAGIKTLFLDTAPRPRLPARALAEEMGARYLLLPYLDATAISRQVQSLAGAPS